ncbi:MAG: hypothetical protein JWN04_5647 [Myxococcaceae bacterium]|nr:hypothetical protein [Myxococcaceae bacterium]
MSKPHSLTYFLLLGACTQHHLSIGGLELDASLEPAADSGLVQPQDAQLEAAARDAGVASFDARSADDSGPLEVQLRVFGRDGIVSVSGHCGSPCTELDVITQGGTPPYHVEWVDNFVGSQRMLCPSSDINGLALTIGQDVMITVTDATQPTPNRQSITPSLLVTACDAADAGPPQGWTVCFTPTALDTVACPDPAEAGQWYALGMPLDEQDSTILASFSGISVLTSTRVELHASSALCDSGSLLSSDTLNVLTTSLRGSPVSADAPAEYLLLRAPDQPDGRLPAGLTTASLQVCFDR